MNQIIHLSTTADLTLNTYTSIYAGVGGTITVNGTSVTMGAGSTLEILVKTITGAAGIYLIGNARIGVPTTING